MFVALVLLLAAGTSDATPEEIDLWLGYLDSRNSARREYAVEQLLAAGDDAADALEMARFRTAGAALLAHDLLTTLRQPTATLRPPPFVGAKQKLVIVELLVSNPRPTPLQVEPLYLRLKRGKGVRRNARWLFRVPKGFSEPQVNQKAMLQSYVVPPRSDLAIPIGFSDTVPGREAFRIEVSYRGDTFRLSSHANIRVGRESLSMLRARAYSGREELRSEAITYLRHRLRVGKQDPEFLSTLRLVARSPYRDMRGGVARALGEHGLSGSRTHTDVLTTLANDRDSGVSRLAFRALVKRGKFRDTPPALRQLASRLLARRGDRRTRYLYEMLGAMTPRDRYQFLASVLAKNRTRSVHAAIASLLRQEGIPIEPASGGLIPRSQIQRLHGEGLGVQGLGGRGLGGQGLGGRGLGGRR